MDLLLQAAKVLELEHADVGSDRVSPRSTRGFANNATPPRVRGENGDNSDGSVSLSENGYAAGEDELPFAERRRSGGAGTREVHNQLEKNRRKQLRECFSQLQKVVPSLENKRVATQSILQGAIKHIKCLKKKDVEQEREIQMLAKRKSEYLQFIRSRAGAGTGAVLTPVTSHPVLPGPSRREDHDDGNVSDSTTTASEGPCNEGDFSDDDGEKPPLHKLDNPARLDRKRKLDARSTGVSALSNPIKHSDLAIKDDHSLRPRAGSYGSKSLLQAPSSSSVSSSSQALKQMLEQKKRNQVALPLSEAPKRKVQESHSSSKTEQFKSHLRPVAPAPVTNHMKPPVVPAPIETFPQTTVTVQDLEQIKGRLSTPLNLSISSKGSAKSVSSLTSSYPMISNHLAAAVRKPVALPPSINPLVDIWTTSSKTTQVPLGIKSVDPKAATADFKRAVAYSPLKSDIVEGSKIPHSNLPAFTTQLHPLLGNTTITLQSSTGASQAQVNPGGISPLLPLGSIKLPPPQSDPAGLKTPEAKKMEASPLFTLSPKALSSLQATDLSNASLLGKNIIGSNTTVGSLHSVTAASSVSSAEWTNSKVVPAIFPLNLSSFLQRLPVQGAVTPLSNFATGQPTIPLSIASVKVTNNAASWTTVPLVTSPTRGKSNVEVSGVKLDSKGSSHSVITLANPSLVNQEIVPTLTDNSTRFAGLVNLSEGGADGSRAGSGHTADAVVQLNSSNGSIRLGNNTTSAINGSVLTPIPSSVSFSSSSTPCTLPQTPTAAATMTLSLPEGLKPMALAPTILPLTWATPGSAPANHTTTGASQFRLFNPLSQNTVLPGSALPSGQAVNGLVSTVVQLGTSAQVALLPPGLAQPVVVMTTHTSANGGTVSGAALNTTVSSSSLL